MRIPTRMLAGTALLAGLLIVSVQDAEAIPIPKGLPIPKDLKKNGATGKGPLPPGIASLVPDVTVITNIPGYDENEPPLKQALHIVKHVNNKELVSKEPSYDRAGKQVRVAEELVMQQAKVPKKGSKRADDLDEIADDLHKARVQLTDHKLDDARNTLRKAARRLDAIIDGKKEDPKKDKK